MKIFSGKFGKDTQQSNSLFDALLKYPEISKVIVDQYPKYSLTYFAETFGRRASKVEIGNNYYQWALKGRREQPSTFTGTSSGTGSGNADFTAETVENYFNPYDLVKLYDGTLVIVQGLPTPSSGGFTYTFKIQTNSSSTTVSSTNFTAGYTAGKVGTVFPEGSDRGYGELRYPDWYRNYLSIARKRGEYTADYLTDVTWIESNGSRLWYPTAIKDTQDTFMYELEKTRWYSHNTVDPTTGLSVVFDTVTGKPLYSGSGYIEQIDSSNIDTWNGNLTEKRISDFIKQLGYESQITDNTWLVHTGTGGALAFTQAMKDYYYVNGVLIYNANAGKDTLVGTNFRSYFAHGAKIVLLENPIKDDPILNPKPGPDGYPAESYNFDFMNFGMLEPGVSNIEIFEKGAGGHKRGFVVKYIPGMIDIYNDKSVYAANSSDTCAVEYLSEGGIIVRNPKSCGRLVFA